MRLVIGGTLHHIDMLQRLYIDNMVVRRSDLLQAQDIYSPQQNRSIDSLSDSDALIFTCFLKPELRKLFVHLRLSTGTVNV